MSNIFDDVKSVLKTLPEFLPEPPSGSIPPLPESIRQFALAQGRAAWHAVNGVLLECTCLPAPLRRVQDTFKLAEQGKYDETMYRALIIASQAQRLYCDVMLLRDALVWHRDLQLQVTVYLPTATRNQYPVTSYGVRISQAMTSILMVQAGHAGLITCVHTVLHFTNAVPCHVEVTLQLADEAA